MASIKRKSSNKRKRQAEPKVFPMGDMIELLLGETFDLKDMPPHMQALIAVSDRGANLKDTRDRRLFCAGFALAINLAKTVGVLMGAPNTKDAVIKKAIKGQVELAAQRVIGVVERPQTGSKSWDAIEGVFWNGSRTPAIAG